MTESLSNSPARTSGLPEISEGSSEFCEQGRIVDSRAYVEKIVSVARSIRGKEAFSSEIELLANSLDATQKVFENLHRAGLATDEVSKKMFESILELAEKFLGCHEKLCSEAIEKALSPDNEKPLQL